MKLRFRLVCAVLLTYASVRTVYASEAVTINSPDGAIRVEVLVNDEGRLCYSVQRVKSPATLRGRSESLAANYEEREN